MSAVFKYEQQLETTSCAVCGIRFAVPMGFLEERRKDAQRLYCPNGHGLGWSKTEADRLREQLQRADDEIAKAIRAKALAESTARMEAEQRRKAEKKLDRINRGVCSKCNRTFANVARHMQTKHGVECHKPPKGSKVRG